MKAALRLIDEDRGDPRMAVAEGVDANAGNHVEVAPSGFVDDVAAVAGFYCEGATVVVCEEKLSIHEISVGQARIYVQYIRN